MKYQIRCLVAILVILVANRAFADSKMLDLIPADASAGVALRSILDLNEKANDLLAEIHDDKAPQLELLTPLVLSHFGVSKGYDAKRPVAIILANRTKSGLDNEKSLNNLVQMIVLAVPVSDLGQLVSGLGLRRDEVVPNKLTAGTNRFCYLRGQYLFVGGHKKAVLSVAEGPSLREAIAETRRKRYESADLVVHFGPRAWGEMWEEIVADLRRGVDLEGDPEGQRVARQLVEAVSGVRFALADVRIENGVAVSLSTFFQPESTKAIEEFLAEFRGGEGASTLKGLPRGNPLFAYAARGDGTRNAVIARSLLRMGLRNSRDVRRLLDAQQRKQVVGAFESVWRSLNGSRAAIYVNPRDADGLLSAIAILDTADPVNLKDLAPRLAQLVDRIGGSVEGDRRGLRVRHHPKQETLAGAAVDVVDLDASGVDGPTRRQLLALLGSDWNKMRITTMGKHVVLMLGSHTDLLVQTLGTLGSDEADLLAEKAVDDAQKRIDGERKMQFHFSVAKSLTLERSLRNNEPPALKEVKSMSSVALTVSRDRLQMDVWLPVEDMRATRRASGF